MADNDTDSVHNVDISNLSPDDVTLITLHHILFGTDGNPDTRLTDIFSCQFKPVDNDFQDVLSRVEKLPKQKLNSLAAVSAQPQIPVGRDKIATSAKTLFIERLGMFLETNFVAAAEAMDPSPSPSLEGKEEGSITDHHADLEVGELTPDGSCGAPTKPTRKHLTRPISEEERMKARASRFKLPVKEADKLRARADRFNLKMDRGLSDHAKSQRRAQRFQGSEKKNRDRSRSRSRSGRKDKGNGDDETKLKARQLRFGS